MKDKYTKVVQALITEETLAKLHRLILIEATEKNEIPKGKSEWLRNLIEDTVNFELNKKKING